MSDKLLMPLEKQADIKIQKPKTSAGGLGAILSTMRQIGEQTGFVRGTRSLLLVNQQHGFDCPGCAWPDPSKRSVAEFCENGAKAVADEATTRRVGPDFFKKHRVDDLLEQSDHWLNKRGRLTHPLVRREGMAGYEAISWDDAFKLVGDTLQDLDSPDEAIFYTSGRTSNEAAFLYQLFAREYGTNNMPDCSNMCHESSGVGLGETIGIGKGTVRLSDFEKSDVILVIGQNPGTNHPRMLSALQDAKRNGAKIISINPLREAGLVGFVHPQEVTNTLLQNPTEIADLFLQVRVGADVPLLKAIMKVLLERESAGAELFDHEFIKTHTAGYQEFIHGLEGQKLSELVTLSGVSEPSIRDAAEIIGDAKSMIACWAMGITQHKNGVANVQEILNLLLLGGHIGREGAGVCPVRGHSNVQGDRTVGIVERPEEAFLNSLKDHFGFQPPMEHGFDTVHAMQAMHEGRAKVFVGMGGNFLSATPDTNYTAEALQRCDLTVQISTKLNRGHLLHGKTALILPCLGRTEIDIQAGGPQFVTVENSMGVVHASRGSLKPAHEMLLSEPDIVARMALAAIPNTQVDWVKLRDRYDEIRNAIEACIPGFEDYNTRVRTPNGFELPNGPRERVFGTPSGKAHFTNHPLPEITLKPGELLMMTMRSHDQYNTTIYGLDDRYRGVYGGRRVVFMHDDDIVQHVVSAGEEVDLISEFEGKTRVAEKFVVVPYDIPRGCVGTYFPEANVLIPVTSFADHSRTPTSKSVVISLRKR